MKIYEIIDSRKYRDSIGKKDCTPDEQGLRLITEIDKTIDDFNTLLDIDGDIYRITTYDINNAYIIVDELEEYRRGDIEISDAEDQNWDDEYIICPVCGYKEWDSFEVTEYDGAWECPYCGSTLEVEPDYHVTYHVHCKEPNRNIVKI